MAFSPVATFIFASRNVDKASNGDDGRAVVAGCQGINFCSDVVNNIFKYDSAVAKTARSAASVFSEMAKESKAFDYAGKAIKWGCNNVNPLICASGALKVLRSDDKVNSGITEAAALATMFAGENIVKGNYERLANSETAKNALKAAKDSRILKPLLKYTTEHKLNGKIGMVTKGLALVGGSIASYDLGQHFGKDIAKHVTSNLNLEYKA